MGGGRGREGGGCRGRSRREAGTQSVLSQEESAAAASSRTMDCLPYGS